VSRSSTTLELNGNQYDKITGQLIGSVQSVADSLSHPTVATQSVHKGLERSRTLMRSVVSKPAKSKSTQTLATKNAASWSNPARAERAKTIDKNRYIKRFQAMEPMQIRAAGVDVMMPKAKAQPIPAVSAPKKPRVVAPATARPMPSMVTSVSHQQLERLLDRALINADSHKKRAPRRANMANTNLWQRIKSTPKWVSVGSVLALVALLAGFFIWQNIPQIAMRLAASKAHISASLPAYTPSGFSYTAPINYAKGAITVNYKSPQAGKSFSLTQEASNWSSSSLAANAIPAEAQVQTAQVNGTTVYVYGDKNDATWVNHGVRYTISDHANLNSDQILRIANSL